MHDLLPFLLPYVNPENRKSFAWTKGTKFILLIQEY